MLNMSWLPSVSTKTIVLASASPRRRELLSEMGIKFEVLPTLTDDANDPEAYQNAASYVSDTAEAKAQEVWTRCQNNPALPDADIVIAADTVINASIDHCSILNKPQDADHAKRMLTMLSGKKHEVLTAVHILFRGGDNEQGGYRHRSFVESTIVEFADIDDGLLRAYIASGEPFDKAGGYGIQGSAAMFIKSIQGDYFNVVGLPKHRLYEELKAVDGEYEQWDKR